MTAHKISRPFKYVYSFFLLAENTKCHLYGSLKPLRTLLHFDIKAYELINLQSVVYLNTLILFCFCWTKKNMQRLFLFLKYLYLDYVLSQNFCHIVFFFSNPINHIKPFKEKCVRFKILLILFCEEPTILQLIVNHVSFHYKLIQPQTSILAKTGCLRVNYIETGHQRSVQRAAV